MHFRLEILLVSSTISLYRLTPGSSSQLVGIGPRAEGSNREIQSGDRRPGHCKENSRGTVDDVAIPARAIEISASEPGEDDTVKSGKGRLNPWLSLG
jgi:hypothetical protein